MPNQRECALLRRAARALLVVLAPIAVAQTRAPKPDLHAGGIQPTVIPNGQPTEATLPGFHLTGARVETDHLCKVISYKVVSDNEIKMTLQGTRGVDDKEDQCGITVRTSSGSASTWLVVELTPEEAAEQKQRQEAEGQEKAAAFVRRSGKAWRLTFAGGTGVTYTADGGDDDAMPTFRTDGGAAAKIAVSDDNKVMIIEEGCVRSGTLSGTSVKDGQSRGNCTPAGGWTATVTH
ncbi:MAG TPA: hypothetical protein VG267_21035 [Terracidiphilus sp.]|jgi:hypothetical protein|nr:hypothetical protein [Terracidiphilus sp.]